MKSAALLMCASIDRRPDPVGDSERNVCSACGAGVWLSSAGRRTMREHPDCAIVCELCGFARAGSDPNLTFSCAEGALDEVNRLLGPAAVDHVQATIADLNRASRRAAARRARRGYH